MLPKKEENECGMKNKELENCQRAEIQEQEVALI
jgi:hypothetical protein